ncbi:exosortase A [Marinobacter sp.]|uniref:exosortase A n=1 Tax=Marinobacter sp. TaxID=50741 RepID=UPI0019C6301E|nr:exosortase A [Marinobacter sp.]MBC7191026.1 EpsI family protein [Marinobacter sp.]
MHPNRITRNYKILLLSLPLLVLALFQEWLDYFQLWTNSYIYRHGLLVFAGTLFLLFQRKEVFSNLRPSFSWIFLIILICLIATLLVAHAGNIKLARLLLLPLILIAWGATLWGRPFVTLAAGPILLLLFGAPFWDEMSPALQWLTVAVDERALSLLSIPATIDEFYIRIPSGVFHVAHGCSGIRYLMVGLYLGAFYGVLTNSGPKRTAFLLAAAGLLSLLANWIRVASIIAAGHYTNMESSLVDDHEMFGWAVFVAVTLIPFFILTHYLDKRGNSHPATPALEREQPAPAWKPAFISASLPLIAVPVALLLQSQVAQSTAEKWNPELPELNTERWTGPLRYAEFWEPKFRSPDIKLSGVYVSDQQEQAQLDFLGYHQQTQGKELIYYQNTVFNPDQWDPLNKTTRPIAFHNPWNLNRVNQMTFTDSTSEKLALVWYWYDVGGSLEISPAEVQIASSIKNLIGDQRAGIWILTTMCKGNNPGKCATEGGNRLQSLIQQATPDKAD